jgi:hypothetical protein
MLEFRTAGFNPYSVKYSPFFDSRLAVSAGANFGLVGNGRLFILNLTADGIVREVLRNPGLPLRPDLVRTAREPAPHCGRRWKHKTVRHRRGRVPRSGLARAWT